MAKKMNDIIPPERSGGSPLTKNRRIPKLSEINSERPRRKVGKVKRTMFGGIRPDTGEQEVSKGSKRTLWVIAIVAILFLIISIATIFEHATLKITPKQRTVDLDFVFTAVKDSTDEDKISFKLMNLSEKATRTVPATETKEVERRASGTIVVYNNYEEVNRRLVKNTRFETPEGLIYRVYESIVVPALQIDGGKKVPGSIEVTVYADEPGDAYNIGLTDFTVPGFKNDPPRFEGFYARSKTPMEGGFVGRVKAVAEEDLREAQRELEEDITAALIKNVGAQVPEDFILFDDGIFVTFANGEDYAEQTDLGKDEVEVVRSATLKGILFDREVLSQNLGEKIIPQLNEDDELTITNLEDLTFKLLNKDSLDINEDTTVSFSLVGRPHFVWQFDEQGLIQALQDKSKKEFEGILEGFPSISQAEVVIRPFWKRSFPEKESRFSIEKIITK